MAECDVPEVDLFDVIPSEYIRKKPANLPEVSEPQVVRHYVNLSIKNHHVDRNFYPSWIQKIRTQSQICDWNQNEKDVEFLCKNLKDKSFDPYLSLFMINDSALQFKIAKLYVENKYKNWLIHATIVTS